MMRFSVLRIYQPNKLQKLEDALRETWETETGDTGDTGEKGEKARDSHADVDRMPIRNMRRYNRHMSDKADFRIDAHRQIYPHGHP